ncbi:hypothetical protein CUMW_233410 [Citrus unshiu]|uniref:Uncharacterized protein n=1 Tax=Citrus unshiu TaxID=55188 RepID=A0A2H5QIG6_CITUN|nr:hypothetical protein CUMW_233410 [Citrus unshiu]
MATVTPTTPPPFTFVLEYMGSAMMIKSIRPMHYTLLRLCNIAALVLQTRESPAVHYFHPKVVLSWDGRMVDVNTDDALKTIIRLSIKGCCSLHVVVRFSVNGAHSPTLGPPSKLCHTREDVPVVRDAVGHSDQNPAATTAVQPIIPLVGVKRRYRCTVCKADGHGKRTCKLVNPTPATGGDQCHGSQSNGVGTTVETADGTTQCAT